MKPFLSFWRRLRSLGQRRAMKREIDEELRLHLELRTAENIAAGMSPEEAARDARRRFGNLQSIREECREVRGASFGEATWQDIRFGLRMLRKNPGFTTVAVLTLALGIGANTTIFSVFKTLIFDSLPYPDPDRIVQVWAVPSSYELRDHVPVGVPDYLDLRAQCHSFAEICAYNSWQCALGGDPPEMIHGVRCTASLGHVLGMRPALGRWFTEDEEKPDAQPVAVLTHALWERRFGADPKVIGQKIRLTDGYGLDDDFIVVGVLPPGMDFSPIHAGDVFFPLCLNRQQNTRRSTGIVYVLARLGPGVMMQAASSELTALGAQLARADPSPNWRFTFRLVPLKQQLVGGMTVALMLMQGAVLLVLGLACANVAGMLLARAARRQTEIAVRVALGAGRWHVLRLMLAESFAISLLAVALGLLLAVWGMDVLARLAPGEILIRGRFHVDGPVLIFAMGLAMLTTVLAGLPPTLVAVKTDVLGALKEGGPQQAGSRARLRQFRWLVISQVALSLVLINVALLLTVSYRKVAQDSRAFITDQVVTGDINMLGHSAYNKIEARVALRDRLIESLRALPGVKAVGTTDRLPFQGSREYPILADAEAYDPKTSRLRVSISCVTTGYFDAAGVAILEGRMVTAADAVATPQGILINRTLARHYWGEGNPIGKSLRNNQPKPPPTLTWQVVGVVEDVRQSNAEKPARPEIYLFNPADVEDEHEFGIVVRANGDSHRLVPAIRQVMARLDPSLALDDARTMTEVFDDSTRIRRFQMLLIDVFMAVALLLTAVGIYGSMAFYVAARTREIGLRMALGATLGDVVGLIVSQVAVWLAVGVAIGVGLALGAGVVLRSMFYQTSPLSPFCLAGSLGVVALAALVACWLPARRAASINPMQALRNE